ncbi:MAG: hypothetical protein HKN35_15895 [Woeseia sp.]|nr:hypothetical protein [Woeseia sp.]
MSDDRYEEALDCIQQDGQHIGHLEAENENLRQQLTALREAARDAVDSAWRRDDGTYSIDAVEYEALREISSSDADVIAGLRRLLDRMETGDE